MAGFPQASKTDRSNQRSKRLDRPKGARGGLCRIVPLVVVLHGGGISVVRPAKPNGVSSFITGSLPILRAQTWKIPYRSYRRGAAMSNRNGVLPGQFTGQIAAHRQSQKRCVARLHQAVGFFPAKSRDSAKIHIAENCIMRIMPN